jgi:hypothetical protein
LALLFGGAVLSIAVMDFLVFFNAKWESVKIPLITIIIFCFTGFGLMLYIQFGLEGVHAWNWMNTSAYLIMGIGFAVALFLELKARKAE